MTAEIALKPRLHLLFKRRDERAPAVQFPEIDGELSQQNAFAGSIGSDYWHEGGAHEAEAMRIQGIQSSFVEFFDTRLRDVVDRADLVRPHRTCGLDEV